MNWDKYRYFSKAEFDCQETGENEMSEFFIAKLSELREKYGKPMVITSGYRSPNHTIEQRKRTPGTHAQGIAADISCQGADKYRIVKLAFDLGFSGIGIDDNFIHLDISGRRNAIWSY